MDTGKFGYYYFNGYIEFLPGKASGMSSDCFPEIITGDVPHIYIYTSKNPNEAIIAKRRAYAVVTDHITPYMQSAKLYDELCEMDDLLLQHNNAALLNETGRKKILCGDIRNLAVKLKLLPASEEHPLEKIKDDEVVEKVHNKLFLLRDSNINDGLHILSKTNDHEKTARMILAILKYDGSLPSIRRCILDIMDLNYDEIIKNPRETHLLDKEMREFYEQNNPWALEELARRFLEAEQRGLWKADPQVLKDLKEIYLEIEGWIEDKMEDIEGEFQGGSVDIMTKTDVKEWGGRSDFNIDDYLMTK